MRDSVVAAIALFAGLAANRWLRPRLLSEDDGTGMTVRDLVGPLLTLTVLCPCRPCRCRPRSRSGPGRPWPSRRSGGR
ncbi:hypothetical protein E6R60_15260 [Streptomyces sp. A0642]|nr:hypothetical protein E6R60_15260 [Streptomyces sp. A0642]